MTQSEAIIRFEEIIKRVEAGEDRHVRLSSELARIFLDIMKLAPEEENEPA